MDDVDRSIRDETTTLESVERLAAELAESKVRYCHWKSNEAIDRSLRGDNDLDLLVHRDDAAAFVAVAARLGFRPALPPPPAQIPGILDLFGLDRGTGRMVHLQAHFRLVLGDDMTKNFRLPIEAQYLADVDDTGVLPLPRPEYEYLVFVVRMVLKHCTWDAQISYKGRLTPTERRELVYLEERIDRGEVDRLRREHLPTVSAELFARCRNALEPRSGPWTRAIPAAELVAALEGYGSRSRGVDTALKLGRRLSGFVRGKVRSGVAGKRLMEGGAVVAVLGGDGSGKSSAVSDLETFLGRHVVTRRLHLGKPQPSVGTRIVRRLIRRLAPNSATGAPVWEVERSGRFPGHAYFLWYLMTARDRYREHLRARRAAGRGAVVVCDRYPIAGLETMDGPRLHRVPGARGRPLAMIMSRLERGYYERIGRPDAVVVLRVDPDVAIARRPDQDEEFVRRRAEEIQRRHWNEPDVFVVDAGRPIDQVHNEVRAIVWSAV